MANNKDITGRTGKGGRAPSSPSKIVTSGGNPSKGGMKGGPPNGSSTNSPEKNPNKIVTQGSTPRSGGARGSSKTPATNMKAMGRGC